MKNLMMKKTRKGSGNIFEDLGFNPAEASNLRLRTELMMAIKNHIKKHKLTQLKAAELMGISQPRTNKLLAGHIELFTIDTLVKMLERAGVHVSLKLAA